MKPPWEQDHYSFTGPGVAISCDVEYDRERECYVAKTRGAQEGDGYHVGTGDNRHAAALNCFRAWMTNDHAYWQQADEDGGEKV